MAFDRNAWQRSYRKKNRNAATRRYERETKKGFLVRAYRTMKSRVTGVQKREAHYYVGLSILAKETFYEWSLHDADFNRLWGEWQAAGRVQRLTPSVDRQDVTFGYELFNIRWVTQSENSGRLTRRDYTTRARGDVWHAARQKDTCRL